MFWRSCQSETRYTRKFSLLAVRLFGHYENSCSQQIVVTSCNSFTLRCISLSRVSLWELTGRLLRGLVVWLCAWLVTESFPRSQKLLRWQFLPQLHVVTTWSTRERKCVPRLPSSRVFFRWSENPVSSTAYKSRYFRLEEINYCQFGPHTCFDLKCSVYGRRSTSERLEIYSLRYVLFVICRVKRKLIGKTWEL